MIGLLNTIATLTLFSVSHPLHFGNPLGYVPVLPRPTTWVVNGGQGSIWVDVTLGYVDGFDDHTLYLETMADYEFQTRSDAIHPDDVKLRLDRSTTTQSLAVRTVRPFVDRQVYVRVARYDATGKLVDWERNGLPITVRNPYAVGTEIEPVMIDMPPSKGHPRKTLDQGLRKSPRGYVPILPGIAPVSVAYPEDPANSVIAVAIDWGEPQEGVVYELQFSNSATFGNLAQGLAADGIDEGDGKQDGRMTVTSPNQAMRTITNVQTTANGIYKDVYIRLWYKNANGTEYLQSYSSPIRLMAGRKPGVGMG